MIKLIKEIRKAISYQDMTVEIYEDDSVLFSLYNVQITIIYKNNEILLTCEICNSSITIDMMKQILTVMEILKANIDTVKKYIERGD